MTTAHFLEQVSALSERQETVRKYAEHLKELFEVIDPSRIGDAFSAAVANCDCDTAVKLLADYYRNRPAAPVAELSATGAFNAETADKAAAGIMREVNIDWVFPDGKIDFLFDPTERKGPRNHEWLWQFNRHTYWTAMARAYVSSGREAYAAAFRDQLLRWIGQTDIPEKWNAPGSAWRTIECGLRLLGSWQVAFDGFRSSPTIEDATLLLMIASMHRQSVHLVNNPTQRNWLMMESNGVYTFSALFPELTDATRSRDIAAHRLLEELEKQILPDGMQNELSPDYQLVVYSCACNFYDLACNLGLSDEIPRAFVDLIKKTVDAAILLSTPALTQPRTNDTFTITTKSFTKRAERLLGENATYRFVNTERCEGEPPRGSTPSAFLPYAGFAVMRSDWGADAAYLCFDVGPLGTAHVHQDKLNINLFKGDTELIFDDGGGQYEISPARSYALSGYGHNTVLVDGLSQCRKAPALSESPIDASWITNAAFDYAAATYDDTFGAEMVKPATHRREIRFSRPDFFCVTDTLTSSDGKPHDYEVLFHLDTTRVHPLPDYRNAVISGFGGACELAIIPVDEDERAESAAVSAATEPMYRGWYNGRNERSLHEAITVSRTVRGALDYRFTTLLFPIKRGQELPQITRNGDGTVTVRFLGRESVLDLSALSK